MRPIRTTCLVSLLLVALLCAGLMRAGAVSATTGNTAAKPVPALYKVPLKVADLYPGQYSLESAAPGARLRQMQMLITMNSLHYLQGVATIYGYDAQGFQTSSVVTMYNFRLVAPSKMTIEVLGPLGTPLLGYLYLQRASDGDLSGQIQLASKARYAVALHRSYELPATGT